jgi:hypothetical protein
VCIIQVTHCSNGETICRPPQKTLASDSPPTNTGLILLFRPRKTFRVSGKITGMGKEILGSPYVMIGDKVQAVFDSKDEDSLSRYDKGMSVTANCTIGGKMVWVLLKDCRLQKHRQSLGLQE